MNNNSSSSSSSSSSDIKKLRIQNKHLYLTYTYAHYDHDLINYIESKTNNKIIAYVLSHETGKEDNHPHTHTLIIFKKRLDISNPRFLDFKGTHPNVKYVTKTKIREQYFKIYDYIIKVENGNKDKFILVKNEEYFTDYKNISWAETVQKCDTLNEAYNLSNKLRDVVAIKTLFENKNFDFCEKKKE